MASRNGVSTRPEANLVLHNDPMMRDPRIQAIYSAIRAPDPMSEIGTSGLRQYGGFVVEEWLRQLQGKKGAWAYREMSDNSSVVGGIMFAIKMLARKADWWVEGGTETMPNGMPATEFVQTCMHDMSHTWGDTISESLSMLVYGWSFHEEVYKRRLGEQPDQPFSVGDISYSIAQIEEDNHPASSKYTDGLIGWRKLPVRAQETLLRWWFNGYAGIQAMEQVDWHGGRHIIPIQKALLFRTEATRNNPEGRSILRNAWLAWYNLQNIQSIEAIGIERDLAGLPKAVAPENVDIFAPKNTELLELIKKMISGVRKDEEQGVILPWGWEFELMSTSGSRTHNTDDVIRRYRQEIAAVVLGDFLLVGLDGLGSYAMVDVKADLFGLAVDATLDIICEIFNRYSIPRLMKINGAKINEMPRISHSSTGRIDLEKVGNFLRDMALAGAPIPWSEEMIEQLFNEAGLPAKFPSETVQNVHKAEEVGVGPVLATRAAALTLQLEREIEGALGELGVKAAHSYLRQPLHKNEAGDRRRLIARILKGLNVRDWARVRLGDLFRNHAARTAADTSRVLSAETGRQFNISEAEMGRIESQAGRYFQPRDIEPQVRDGLERAIREGFRASEPPQAIAKRIEGSIPPGRFTKAGSAYRSRLIARDQTLHLQRLASLAAYKSDGISQVRVVDGIYGPPRSDQECIDRSGEIVSVDEAYKQAPELHPQCTVSYQPIV